jgi:hypothetical protein
MIAAGRACQHHQQCTGYQKKREHRSGSDGFSVYLGGFNPFPERRCALRFKDCDFFREVHKIFLSIRRNYNIKKYSTKRPDATQKEWYALRPT